jgi:Flp pilus assembly pilin Flp
MANPLLHLYVRARAHDQGQTVVEYALIVCVVSIALILLMAPIGQDVISKSVSKVSGILPA